MTKLNSDEVDDLGLWDLLDWEKLSKTATGSDLVAKLALKLVNASSTPDEGMALFEGIVRRYANGATPATRKQSLFQLSRILECDDLLLRKFVRRKFSI